MSLTAADIIAITAAGNSVSIGPDGSIVISPAALASRGPLTAAEKQRAYRQRHKTVTGVTEKVTLNGETVTGVTETVTGKVTLSPKTVTSVTKKVTPPSSPLPLPPGTPNPHAPTPEHVRDAHAHTREDGELFETDRDQTPPAKAEKPHKRIRWSPETGWTGITPGDKAAWAEAFPACDIARQLSTADLWLRANPAKARKQNFFRFLTNWLERKQERGGDAQSAPVAKLRPPPAGDPCKVEFKVFSLDDLERQNAEDAKNPNPRRHHANR